jgi:hypothetical protein
VNRSATHQSVADVASVSDSSAWKRIGAPRSLPRARSTAGKHSGQRPDSRSGSRSLDATRDDVGATILLVRANAQAR